MDWSYQDVSVWLRIGVSNSCGLRRGGGPGEGKGGGVLRRQDSVAVGLHGAPFLGTTSSALAIFGTGCSEHDYQSRIFLVWQAHLRLSPGKCTVWNDHHVLKSVDERIVRYWRNTLPIVAVVGTLGESLLQ